MSVHVCMVYSCEQDAVMAEQLQSAEMVNGEHERMQSELKDEVSQVLSSFVDITSCWKPMNAFSRPLLK